LRQPRIGYAMNMQVFRRLMLMGSLTGVVAVSGLTGCSSWETGQAKETGRTTAQFSSDKATTRRVEQELKTAPVYKFPDVKVDTFDGVVQLSGFVHTEDQKRAAAE